MKKVLLLSLLMSMTGLNLLKAQEVMDLYPGKIPGAKEIPSSYKEIETIQNGKLYGMSKVTHPTIAVYKPEASINTGTAVIICPGGGYSFLAIAHEGAEVAKAFTKMGVTAIVLKYRLPDDTTMLDKSFGPLQDAQQAIYTVRKNASKWGINPNKIGIMGFSAGGHLASSLAVHYMDVKIENKEKITLRPDFAILIYPVISFINSPHQGSADNLIGKNGTKAQKQYFSNEMQVNEHSPIAFLVHANNDDAVPVENSIMYNQAMVKYKVPVETHLYEGGGHGFGLHNPTTQDNWFERLENWMKSKSLLKPSK